MWTDVTERPEGVKVGIAKVVGIDLINNFSWADENPFWQDVSPYGDGKAAKRIVASILTKIISL